MSFKELIGRPDLRRILVKAIETATLSHAVLLTGPPGSGKKTWARAIAGAVLCSDRRGAEPCARCPSCRRIAGSCEPNLYLVEPEKKKIKIDQFRTLRSKFYLKGGSKVCLVESAETMTGAACSSLLKILEEPPDGLYFILLSSKPGMLFDTILSRCQRYALQPLKPEEILVLLAEKRTLSGEKASFLARFCGGLPGPALEMASDDQFDLRLDEAGRMAKELAAGKGSARDLLNRAALLAERNDLILFLELLAYLYRDGLIRMTGCRESLFHFAEPGVTWPEDVSREGLEESVVLVGEALRQLKETNVNRRLLMEKTLITIQRRLALCPL